MVIVMGPIQCQLIPITESNRIRWFVYIGLLSIGPIECHVPQTPIESDGLYWFMGPIECRVQQTPIESDGLYWFMGPIECHVQQTPIEFDGLYWFIGPNADGLYWFYGTNRPIQHDDQQNL